jgi:MFS family permease
VSFNFFLLFCARCLVGLTAPATWIAASSLIADLYKPAQRGRATMVVAVGQFLGTSAAFALGGELLVKSGPTPDGWRWAMLWLTAPLIMVMFTLLAMREPPRTGVAVENTSSRQAFAECWGYRSVIVPLFVGIVMLEIALGSVMVWAPPMLSRNFALSPDRVGGIIAIIVLVSGILGPIAGGAVADLCHRAGGPRQTISVLSGLALLGILASLFAFVPWVTPASALLAVFTTIVSAILVTGTTLFIIVVPNELRGLCMAALTGVSVLLGLGLAPVAVSLLSGAIGGPPMIGKALAFVCVAASLLGAVAFASGRPYFPRAV